MGLVIRQSIYSTVISYVGVAIGYINLLYLYPKYLTTDQLGLLRTIQDAAILLTPFAQFGLTHSIFRFYPQFSSTQKTSGTFISLMLLLSIAGFGVFLLVFKLFEQSILGYFEANAGEIIQYAALVLWLTLILLITSILESYSRSLLKTVFPNLLREVIARLFLSVFVLLYFTGYLNFNQFIISTILGYLACLLMLSGYLFLSGDLKLNFSFSTFDGSRLRELFQYSLLSFAGTAGIILIGKIDSIMVSALLGLTANAVYTNAFYMASVIEIPKRALTQLAMPLIARAFDKKDLRDIQTIYQKTAINQFIIGTLILIGVWANLDNIFHLMPKGETFAAGKYVVMLVGVGKLIDMLFGPSSEIIVLSKYYWFNIILITLLAISIVVANNTLIPAFGINGAAMAAALALVIFNFVKFCFIWFTLKMQPFGWAAVKVVFISGLTLVINYFIPVFDNVFADMLIRSGLITIFFAALIYFSKATPDGNETLIKIISTLRDR